MPYSHTADQPIAPRGRDTGHKQSHDIKFDKDNIEVKQPALSFLALETTINVLENKEHTHKLEDLNVLRRSPDLLNNVKIGQGHYSL